MARYIVNCFKQVRLREYQETGPRTVAAGQLLHLRTDFEVNLRNVPAATSLGTDMLRLLHPTSAVCGMPKAAALDFLRRHEGYDRAYYSGFLGPVNVAAPGVSRLFVNLRCLQVRAEEAILYAGTGLTADSDPLREWQETGIETDYGRRGFELTLKLHVRHLSLRAQRGNRSGTTPAPVVQLSFGCDCRATLAMTDDCIQPLNWYLLNE
ncbi:MAG: chorismate-binding protein [Hymenobacter sp.]